MTIQCKICRKLYTLEVSPEQLGAWKSGTLIQHAMPQLTSGERELIISKVCDTCFEAMFGLDDDVESNLRN